MTKFPETKLGNVISLMKAPRAGNLDLPILSMTMSQGLVDQSSKFKKRIASANTSNYKIVNFGELVVGFPIDEGVLSFQHLYDRAIVSPAYEVWEIKEKSMNANFLESYLRSPRSIDYYKQKLRGSTARRRSLPRDVFLDLKIPFPPLDEQKRILEIFDKAEELKKLKEKADRKTEELIFSCFYDIASDAIKLPLSDIAAINPSKPTNLSVANTDKIPFVPMEVVDEVKGKISEYHVRKFEEISKGYRYFENDDVLFAKITPCMQNGKHAIFYGKNGAGFGFGSTEFHVIRGHNHLHNAWIHTYLRSSPVIEKAKNSFTGTAGQQRVPKEFLEKLLIPVPDITAIHKYHEIANKLKAYRSNQDKVIEYMEILDKSLSQEAFLGKL